MNKKDILNIENNKKIISHQADTQDKKEITGKDWAELKKWKQKQDEAMQKKFGFDLNEEKLKERTTTLASLSHVLNKVVKTQKAVAAIILTIMFIIAMGYFATSFYNAGKAIPEMPKPQKIINDVKELQNK